MVYVIKYTELETKIRKLKEEIKKAKICCVHNMGDDHDPCGYTTKEVLKIIDKVFKKSK